MANIDIKVSLNKLLKNHIYKLYDKNNDLLIGEIDSINDTINTNLDFTKNYNLYITVENEVDIIQEDLFEKINIKNDFSNDAKSALNYDKNNHNVIVEFGYILFKDNKIKKIELVIKGNNKEFNIDISNLLKNDLNQSIIDYTNYNSEYNKYKYNFVKDLSEFKDFEATLIIETEYFGLETKPIDIVLIR